MTDLGDVVDDLELGGGVVDIGGDDGPPPEEQPGRKQRGRRRGSGIAKPPQDDQVDTTADREVSDLLQSSQPRPVKEQKTLGDLYAKWGIPRPDFKVQVWRLMPKFYPGGTKADGFYDEYQNALYEEDLLREYGGGTLMVKIVGPNKTDPRHTQPYESMQIELSGEPNYERKHRAAKPVERSMTAPASASNDENPRLAEKALVLISGQADQERAERHRVEDRAAVALGQAQQTVAPLVDAERRRADEVMAVERKRSEEREANLTERIRTERERADVLEQRLDSIERDRPSMGSTLREVADVLKPNSDTGQMAERMLKDVRA